MDPVTRHTLLLTTISDHLGNSGPEYDNFIEHMKRYVPHGKLASKKTLLDKLAALANLGHLKPGKYDVLKTISELSGNANIKELVEEAEKDIRSVNQGKTTDTGSHTERTNQTIYTRVQGHVSADDHQIPPKRPREELDAPDPVYYTDNRHRGFYDNKDKEGLLLILNSTENRKGTENDVANLKRFFGNMLGFTVYDPRSHENTDLSTQYVDQVLAEVRRHLDGHLGKNFYYFICVILSHGDERGIKTKDGIKSIENIRESFNNRNIPNFAGRPKVFLIQACRGLEQQDSISVDEADDEVAPKYETDESDEIVEVPTDADTMLAFATTLGYKSFRRITVGSWFITECIRVFEEYYREDHLEDMLISVREKVALQWRKQDGAKQMPCVWSTLTKRLKFSDKRH